MARYDRGYDRGRGIRRPRIWGRGDEYVEFTDFDEMGGEAWGPGLRSGGWGGAYRGGGRGYDRGVYGGDHPAFGGYPGGGREGIHYEGGRGGAERPDAGRRWWPQRYDAGYRGGHTRGYDRGERMQRPAGYGGDFAREPFMPEAAYLRHPEYDRPPTYHQNRWEQPGRYEVGRDAPMSDGEIHDEVRQRLFQDSWLRADEIDVSVADGVVTLRGEVRDFLEARYAWDDAWESDGVRGVINNLTIRADPPHEAHGDAFPQDAGDRS